MRKRAVVGLAACVALAGCSTTDGPETAETTSSTVETTAAGDGPRGFQFESGFLEFGDFDPDTLGDEIFNPCTEITPEEYAAAGFGPVVQDVELDEILGKGLSHCYLEVADERATVRGFSNARINADSLPEVSLILSKYSSQLIPELLVYTTRTAGDSSCFTHVDTVRGGFGTIAGGFGGLIDQGEACTIAIRDFESLFSTHGVG